jgi:type III secretion protein J
MCAHMAIAAPRTSRLRFWGVLVLFLCASLLSACKTELFAHLEEADANAVMTALYAEGISAVKTPVDEKYWRIEVDESDQQRALLVARNQGVPRERFANMGDLFKKEGLVSTPSEVRMRYVFALSQELSNTLSHIDGVISARVHPVIPVNDPLSDKTQPASAAVFIKHLPDADLQKMAPAIKTLIARSIEGLKVENVSLTFFSTRAPLQALPQPSGGLQSGSVGSGLTLLLTALLAMTWGAFGWVMWRRQPRRSGKTGTVVESTPRSSPPGNEGEAHAVGGNAALWHNRRATDLLVVPSATAGAVAQSAAPSLDASTKFAIDSVDRG